MKNTTKGSSAVPPTSSGGPTKPTNSTLKKSTKALSLTGTASNVGSSTRPASAKAQTSYISGSTAKQLSQVTSSKDVDAGIHMTQILTYYRQRVEAFEKDRMQWYEKLQQVRPKQELVHRVEWELKKRQEEKAELERTMQEMQQMLYAEREQIVKIKQETDQLKIKGKENRQLIAELLDKNNAVEQHVYYQKDQ